MIIEPVSLMIGIPLIMLGVILTLEEEKKKYLILAIIGVITILIGIGIIIANDIDCQNYCRCEEYDYHELRSQGFNSFTCKCSNENPIIKRASDACARSCRYNEQAYYNQATGRCYCT